MDPHPETWYWHIGKMILLYCINKNEDVGFVKKRPCKASFRKNKIGRLLVEDLLSSAKEKNYKKMRLDTFLKLQAAVHLYQKFGFENISAYYNNPLTGVVYMEKNL
jgi:GNAT superfamily N-acetyltransferase